MTEHERRDVVREVRRLRRGDDPIVVAASTIVKLRLALFETNDQGGLVRASGDCECSICGALYREHATVPGVDWLHAICTGLRAKL